LAEAVGARIHLISTNYLVDTIKNANKTTARHLIFSANPFTTLCRFVIWSAIRAAAVSRLMLLDQFCSRLPLCFL
jgi:hypothetical protein